MDSRRRDAVGPQQTLQRQLHHLLGFADDIRPALPVEEDVERAHAHGGTAHVIGRELRISHAASVVVQYGCPCAVRRTSRPPAIARLIPTSVRDSA